MKRVTRLLLLLFLIFWMLLIFSFSADDAGESSIKSRGLSYKIAQMFVEDFEEMTEKQQQIILKKISHPLRKTAHFCIFGALSVIAFFNMHFFETMPQKLKCGITFVFCSIYAASDEFHQKFVAGRSCEFRDWVIDNCGIAVGILFCLALLYFWRYKKERSATGEKKRDY